MSYLTYFASNAPLSERPNPHERLLSVNEALEKGIADLPEFMLQPGFDRDMPGMILWCDRDIRIDTESGAFDDGDYDDDFAIWLIEPTVESVNTTKRYCASLEWHRYTPGRARCLIEYIREQLAKTEEIELWHIWMNDGYLPRCESREISISELTPSDIETLLESDVNKGGDWEMLTQYRLVIKK